MNMETDGSDLPRAFGTREVLEGDLWFESKTAGWKQVRDWCKAVLSRVPQADKETLLCHCSLIIWEDHAASFARRLVEDAGKWIVVLAGDLVKWKDEFRAKGHIAHEFGHVVEIRDECEQSRREKAAAHDVDRDLIRFEDCQADRWARSWGFGREIDVLAEHRVREY